MTSDKIHVRLLPEGCMIDMQKLNRLAASSECGAVVTFEGVVRATENARQLLGLEYDHHEVMAESELRRIVQQTMHRFDVQTLACEHRLGMVPVQQASVAILVGAKHRKAAFEACQAVMDQIKTQVPIWKTPVFVTSNSQLDTCAAESLANG